ncbi:MAG: imidazole glycerol phosphate synthase subunit HisH [Myxococcota bacterium]
MKVALIKTGTANIASVRAGLERAGAQVELTQDADTVKTAPAVVLPGVGAFAASLQPLRENGLEEPLRERIRAGRPTLAVCVGLQLLCDSSEESPGATGLGVFALRVTRFGLESPRVPQLGWNRIECDPECSLLESGHVYFANSYRLPHAPDGWSSARAQHGSDFVAGVERGAVLACQFHPELSGALGRRILERWTRRAKETVL